jgi:excinuclease ABC subunit A
MNHNKLVVKGAREHNLKGINLEIPRNGLVVITGLSGSGKSSLAFDTIYAEGQRRYVESLSPYARQFLGVMEKPDVDVIEGLSPAVSIEQRKVTHNPRSTVGTITEIYDYLRLLFARVGDPYCYNCGSPITRQSVDQIVNTILLTAREKRILVLSPLVRGKKGEYRELFQQLKGEGFVRIRVDDIIYDVNKPPSLSKGKRHNIELVVDRLQGLERFRSRIADSVEIALRMGSGVMQVSQEKTGKDLDGKPAEDLIFSEKYACVKCEISYPEIEPRIFSFNSPYGACPGCDGIGEKHEVDVDLLVEDPAKTLLEGAIEPWGKPSGYLRDTILPSLALHYGFNLDTPWKELSCEVRDVIIYGSSDEEIKFEYRKGDHIWVYRQAFKGVVARLRRKFNDTASNRVREQIGSYIRRAKCNSCMGGRLKPESLAVKIDGMTIAEVTAMSIKASLEFFRSYEPEGNRQEIARPILRGIMERLEFLVEVGLDYLTLDRQASTLAGGESQRIRLATQIGTNLVGVLYILDEPSIGLHYRDNENLLKTLSRLKDLGNTIIVVEHDDGIIRSADYIIDLGPGAGVKGGKVVAVGTPSDITKNQRSLTGKYLSGKLSIPISHERREGNGQVIVVSGAREHNLKDIEVVFPLGLFICICGVSGSGKSTLVNDILYRALAAHFHKSKLKPGKHDRIEGLEQIDKVIEIDQSPIGRTPRSNPATYTGVFTPIRDFFSMLPESRIRGYSKGRFSFNVKGGRCEACKGEGLVKVEMHFLPDVYVSCELCRGRRYNRETLDVTYKGRSIADVLDMTVDEALEFFKNIPMMRRRLGVLSDVGLGYIRLGQAATTLSGGEAQRVKLSSELSKVSTGKTLYILDEPTTGLHFDDVRVLLKVLHALVDKGNTVVVIEHNLEVVKTADHIIDLGPEGGDDGGRIVAAGPPEEVAGEQGSYTGSYLRYVLKGESWRGKGEL